MTNKRALIALAVVAMFVAVPFLAVTDDSDAALINIASRESGVTFKAQDITYTDYVNLDEAGFPGQSDFKQYMFMAVGLNAPMSATITNFSFTDADVTVNVAGSIDDDSVDYAESTTVSARIEMTVTVTSTGSSMFSPMLSNTSDYRDLQTKLSLGGKNTYQAGDVFVLKGTVEMTSADEEECEFEEITTYNVFVNTIAANTCTSCSINLNEFSFTRSAETLTTDSAQFNFKMSAGYTGHADCPDDTYNLSVGDQALYLMDNHFSIDKNSAKVSFDGRTYKFSGNEDYIESMYGADDVMQETAVRSKSNIAGMYHTINSGAISSLLNKEQLKGIGDLSESYSKAYSNAMSELNGSKAKSHTVLIIVIVAVVVLAGAGIAAFFIIRKKNSVEAPADEAECIVQEDEEPKQ